MPLPMQGDKLLPSGKDVVGRSPRPRAPDRRGGEGLVNARRGFGKSPPAEFGDHGRTIGRTAMGENVDQLAFHLGGLGMAELDPRELLQMLVQEPGMIDHGLQDERLAQRYGGAVAAVDGARR